MVRSKGKRRDCRRFSRLAVFIVLQIFNGFVFAQSKAPAEGPLLITYGNEANVSEGDPTFRQVIYISVPDSLAERFYIRVFDPDTAGEHDAIYGSANTETRFAVFGGAGAHAGSVVTDTELTSGTLLQERSYKSNQGEDGQWINLALLSPSQGELMGSQRFFRLVVETLSGDDGNVYDVVASTRAHRNLSPEGSRLFSYTPTIRVPSRSTLTELRFTTPADQNVLTIGNFDAANADLNLATQFRSLPLTPSGQGEWSDTRISLRPPEQGKLAAITFQGGNEMPNDATFHVTDGENNRLPLDLPALNWLPNRRPSINLVTSHLDNCRSVAFDASQSTNADDDRLSISWRFEDGTSLEGPHVVKEYAEPGSFLERIEVTDDSGQVGTGSALFIPVTVKHPPTPRANVPAIIAMGESITFDASSSSSDGWNIIRREWTFNDDATVTGERINRRFDSPGNYLVVLEVQDDSRQACDNARMEIPFRVNATPVAVAGATSRAAAGTSLSFDAGNSYDPDGALTAYTWDMGDGTVLSGEIVEHAYATAGTYRVQLSVSDDAGVSNSQATDTTTVFVNAPPVALAGPDRTVAIGEVVEFDGRDSADEDGQIIHYNWDFGDGERGSGRLTRYAYASPGTYSVSLVVTDDSETGSNKDSDSLTIRVNAPPVAVAGDDITTSSGEVTFDGRLSSDIDDEIEHYRWDFGDGESGSGATPTHVYRQAGRYDVRLTVSDASGTLNNESSDSLTVLINSLPLADAGPEIIGSPGEELTFQGSRSIDPDGDIVSYEWDFKDGSTASGEIATHTYESAGLYHVRLKVSDNSGDLVAVSFDETQVFINAQPIAEAGDDLLAEPGAAATLNASRSYDTDGQIGDFRWDISNRDEPLYGAAQTVTFDTPGIYTATLTVSDDSGAQNSVAQDQLTIRVNHRPIAEAGPDIHTSQNFMTFDGTASFDADGDALSYQWDFGDGTTAYGAVVTHTYSAGGSYPVVLNVSDGTGLQNGTHRDSTMVTINNPPVAIAGSNQRICTGDILVLDGSQSVDPDGGVLKYAWNFGDGQTSDIVNPTTIYESAGVYPLTLTVTDDSGLDNATHTNRVSVTVDQAPIAIAGADMKVCANAVVSFDGSNSVDVDGVVNQFIWDFGDGGSGGGDKPKYIYDRAGNYPVKLTIHGDQIGQCDYRASDEINVEVTAAPVPVIIAPDAISAGAEVSFDGSTSFVEDGEIRTWSWDFADGTTADGALQTHTFSEPGVYRVALSIEGSTESDDCNSNTTYHVITVNAAPLANAGADITIGLNEEVVLDGSQSSDPDGGISRYEWDLGDGNKGEGVVYRHRYTSAGQYNVVLTVTDTTDLANSSATDTVLVTVQGGATAVLDAPDIACAGESITLSAAQSSSTEAPISSYRWSLGDGSQAESMETSKQYPAPGRYTVSLLVDDGMGRSSSTHTAVNVLQINDPPSAHAGPDQLVCPDSPVVFDASSSRDSDGVITSVEWDFGDGQTAQGARTSHLFSEPGVYQVKLSVTDDSGSSCATGTDDLIVTVNNPPQAQAGPDREVLFGGANDAVQFNGLQSSDPDGSDLAYVWDFGNDEQKTGGIVSHSFSTPGDHEVTLSVSDGTRLDCGTATDTLLVKVRPRE